MKFVRDFAFLLVLVALATAERTVVSNAEAMIENIPVNGTLAKEETIQIEMTGVKDLRYYVLGVKLDSSSAAVGSKIGEAKITCETTQTIPIENGIAMTRYNDPTVCADSTLKIEISNLYSGDVKYWAIAARVENPMYDFVNNQPLSGVLPGHSSYEVVTYRGYIGTDSSSSGAVDFVNVTVDYDIFAESTFKVYISDSPNPLSRAKKELQRVGDEYFYALGRNDELFCHDCYRYVIAILDHAANEPLYFSLKFNVDRGIIHLEHDKITTATVMPDNHGQDFIIDLRDQEYDTDIYLGLQKTDQPLVTLKVDVSLTSFDDGEWDVIKTTNLYSVALREWGINRSDRGFSVGGVYYIRVSSQDTMEPCTFTIVYRILHVQANYLYTGKKHHMVSTNERVAISYYRINVPKEEFVDVQSLRIHMENVVYTYNPGPVYALGFNTYYGRQSSVVTVNNPKDPKTYSYTTYEQYKQAIDFVITEDEEGFCADCTFGFSIRTTNETAWTISAELGYAPFMLQPNQPRRGSLMPFTGGIETFFYLHQTSYAPVEVAVSRLSKDQPHVALFVSTTPHASMDNHYWTDTTQADDRAEIELTNDHPKYCTDCFYYISVLYLNPEKETDSTSLEIAVNCPEGICQVCKDGFDPSTSCTTCLPGFYGADCKQCKACNHGSCDDGLSGTGQCICDEGWSPSGVCNTCAEGYFGPRCEACQSCNGHGKCLDGHFGSGECDCDSGFDASTRCADCKSGFWGRECKDQCPTSKEGEVCSGQGTCSDKMYGTGRCTCNEGFVGLKCDTLFENDKCNPHCQTGKGACDEEQAVCICYDHFFGKDCKYSPSVMLLSVGLTVLVVIVIVVLLAVVLYIKKKRNNNPKSIRIVDNTPLLSAV